MYSSSAALEETRRSAKETRVIAVYEMIALNVVLFRKRSAF
jgi:hypothetical protein